MRVLTQHKMDLARRAMLCHTAAPHAARGNCLQVSPRRERVHARAAVAEKPQRAGAELESRHSEGPSD